MYRDCSLKCLQRCYAGLAGVPKELNNVFISVMMMMMMHRSQRRRRGAPCRRVVSSQRHATPTLLCCTMTACGCTAAWRTCRSGTTSGASIQVCVCLLTCVIQYCTICRLIMSCYPLTQSSFYVFCHESIWCTNVLEKSVTYINKFSITPPFFVCKLLVEAFLFTLSSSFM